MRRVILIALVAAAGFWFGKHPVAPLHPETVFPVIEHKAFVVVIYAHNQALWCERALSSVFEQDYDHYRVVFVDDGSIDETSARAKKFIVDNNQEDKVILIRNEAKLGEDACLERVIDTCLDREIAIPLDANNWLSSPLVFNALNGAYQNPDVWSCSGQGIGYPSYDIQDDVQTSCYAFLLKQSEPAGRRIRKLDQPIIFLNNF